MNTFADTLTTTGLVAILISLACALFSLLIAQYRKKHAPVQQREAPAQPTAPAAEPAQEPSTNATASALFKRLGRAGLDAERVTASDSPVRQNRMLWE